MEKSPFASRAGEKLQAALTEFEVSINDMVCADLGCSTGGFTSCLLANGAKRVYAVDTGYGVLDWKLRNDPRVVVKERTNALHVELEEPVDIISIDVGWTPQAKILPHAISLLKPSGKIISLLKPHYEAKIAHVSEERAEKIAKNVIENLKNIGISIDKYIKSPITGAKAANTEFLMLYSK